MPKTEIGERVLSDTVAALEADLDGYEPPAAFAVGVATIGPSGGVLDVSYPHVNLLGSWGTVAVLARATGYRSGTETFQLGDDLITSAIADLESIATGDGPHVNLDAWHSCAGAARHEALGGDRIVVAAIIDNIYQPPVDAIDAYLRLHLLSHRAVQPHGVNLNGVFGLLNNVVWTDLGPFEPEGWNLKRLELQAQGHNPHVHLVDKFPRMLDYVVPSGVRIADANRVRLGAHLAEGTTVMHEGFCNFNAGTLGSAMVEGRISAGVVVGDNSDVGGGASIMGTLSGGGTEVISIGERCLLGANGGIGISLGDDCIVEAGCYITAGTRITFPDGEVVKGKDISGANGLLFRRNSENGQIQAIPRDNAGWEGLNEALHAN